MDNSNDKLPSYSFNNNRPKANPYGPFLYALVLVAGVMLGYLVNTVTMGKPSLLGGKPDKLEEIVNYISAKYVDTVNRNQIMDKTIDKMLSNLDPHSVYIPAKDLGDVNESLEGNFEGIGIEFYIVQDTITVVSAISGGPAEGVGMKAGDRIVAINDSIVAGKKIKETDVKKHLRGPKGTLVKVGVMRSGAKKLLEFEIKRDRIPLYSVDAGYMLNNETGYIKISTFSSTTYKEFVDKLAKLEAQGMKKLVIDLRGNPGGYLQAATEIADELIGGDKLLVYTQGKAYSRENYNAGRKGLFEEGNLCILIDQGSASASEILSGAVQDWDRGTIIGRTSFGKGLVQQQYDLSDGSAIRLTVARYYTPLGRSIQRPYDKGADNYYNEIYERYQRGEFVHEDTLLSKDTTVYTTKAGKKLYGGGGIRPDIFVPIDTSAENEYFYNIRSFIPEFIYKYSSRHSEVLESYKSMDDFNKGFVVSDQMLGDFYQFAVAEGLKLDKSKEKTATAKLKLTLKAFIAKQIWRMEGYYAITNGQDNVVAKAIEVLK